MTSHKLWYWKRKVVEKPSKEENKPKKGLNEKASKETSTIFVFYCKSIQVICCLARSRKPIKKHIQHQSGSLRLRAKMATHGLDLGQTGADSMNNGGDHSDCGAHTTESMDLICKL